ncbi:hypothetical protein HN843_01805 [bacterium]|nr:hypothetical protein [bacterium]
MKKLLYILLTMLLIMFAGNALAKPGVVAGPKKQPVIPEQRDNEQEPNNSCEDSYWLVERTVLGEVSEPGDLDYYTFEIFSSNSVTLRTFATYGNQFDTEMTLFNEDCSDEIGYNDDYSPDHYFSELPSIHLSPGRYTVLIQGHDNIETGPYGLVIIGADDLLYNETEPNDEYWHANNPDYNTFLASVGEAGDQDMYRITISSSELVTFTTEDAGYEGMDTEMFLYTSTRDVQLAYSDDYQDGRYFSQIIYSFPEPGIYYLLVKGYGAEHGPYGLSLVGVGVVEDSEASWGKVKQMFN